jgi:hypothetical protein
MATPGVDVMQTTAVNWYPRVMIGANAVSLSSQNPSPVHRPSTVAIELAPGIGFGIDGETLVVDDKVALGSTTFTGHLDDGSFKDRDRVVTRDASSTKIEGAYDWQDYAMVRKGDNLAITCGDSDFNALVTQDSKVLASQGQFASQQYTVTAQGNVTRVQGFEPQYSADIVYTGDTIEVKGASPERTFEITRTPNGYHIQGDYRFQDFDITRTANGLVVSGYYPLQHYVVSQAPPQA